MPKDFTEIEQLFILSQLKKDKEHQLTDNWDGDNIPSELDIKKIIDGIESDILGGLHEEEE